MTLLFESDETRHFLSHLLPVLQTAACLPYQFGVNHGEVSCVSSCNLLHRWLLLSQLWPHEELFSCNEIWLAYWHVLEMTRSLNKIQKLFVIQNRCMFLMGFSSYYHNTQRLSINFWAQFVVLILNYKALIAWSQDTWVSHLFLKYVPEFRIFISSHPPPIYNLFSKSCNLKRWVAFTRKAF